MLGGKYLQYDDTNMWSSTIGEGGALKSELKALRSQLTEANQNLEKLRKTKEQGWFDLPFDEKMAISLMLQAREVKRDFTDLIVVGIGGSSLGAKTIYQALGKQKNGINLHFLDSPDPETLALWAKSKKFWKKTAINVISKSGSTLETMAIFTFLRHELIKAVGEENHAKHVFVTTDSGQGTLRTIAKDNGYRVIQHPPNVGGRFSVLSSVGLFPAACAGIDIRKILKGARQIEQKRRRQGIRHMSGQFAALHYLAMKKRQQKIHVLMPYADKLKEFGMWYRQIWAESLGKKNKGPTPVAASGPVDQHSQLQLYQAGPNDKVITFIGVLKYRAGYQLPEDWIDYQDFKYLNSLKFDRIMKSELQGTAKALAKDGRPNGTLWIPKINEESLGALFHFYALATAYLGQLMGIDAYGQPGVEESKKQVKKLLK